MPSWKKVITSGSDAGLNSLVVSDTFEVNGVEYRTYSNDTINTGTTVVATFPTTDGYAAHFDYLVRTNTDYRAGKIVVIWDGSNIDLTDTSTVDIGDTSGVAFDASINAGKVELEIVTDTNGWIFKSDCKIL